MISSKKTRGIYFAIVTFSSMSLLAGCSWFRIDAVSDTVNYRGNSGSIASLEVPPGLTTPIYDPTYTIARPVSAADVPPPIQAAGQSTVVVPTGVGLNSSLSSLKDGNPVLAVGGRYDQVWAKTGQALARMGLVVASQQYEQGIYTVSVSDDTAEQEKNRNVISRFMSYLSFKIVDGKPVTAKTYRFIIGDRGEQSLIVVGDAAGAPVKPDEASALLSRLKTELAQ